MAKVLLINPSWLRTYGSAKASIASPLYPALGLATIAGAAKKGGHTVRLLDLCYRPYDTETIRNEIREFRPDVVGVTGATPLMNQIRDISCLAKEISSDILVVGGGAHISAMPRESMLESMLDVAVYGEGDLTFPEILDGRPPAGIRGICYRAGDNIVKNPPRPLVENLDDLPMPDWSIYPAQEYASRVSRIMVRRTPAAMIEFSRGCVFKCDYCGSKNSMGLGYRKKSPERCAAEMEELKRLGFREAILADDIFTSDNAWAKRVCEEFVRRDIGMLWTCTNGIRVDSADAGLFRAMKRAGCYRVHFGFESGNDEVLRSFGKGGRASLAQGLKAVRQARTEGMDTYGMYMFGLSADTEASMQDTIDYARTTPVDVMRLVVTVPLPGTKIFNDYRRAGRIRSFDWDLYNVYNTRPIYDHPNLSWETIERFYQKAYREAYWRNPAFLWRRLIRGIKTGEFFWDIYYGIRFFFASYDNAHEAFRYGYRDRWPMFDFKAGPVESPEIQSAKKSSGETVAA